MPFLDAQAEDGRLPNKLKMFGKQYKIQPPLVAYCIVAQNPSVEVLQEIYPKLKAYHQWYYQNRRTSEGLYFWKTPEESGMPEAPRFTDLKIIDHILPVDLNVYLVLQSNALAQIATRLELMDEAKKFEINSKELSEKIQEKLWDSESKRYYNWNLDDS